LSGSVDIFAQAGTTYYVQAGQPGGGTLHISVREAPRPANDAFADATPIAALPSSNSVNVVFATTEPGEQHPCGFPRQSVWYSFTPSTTTIIHADVDGSSFMDAGFDFYQSDAPGLGGLQWLECVPPNDTLTFTAQAGTTYYFQAKNYGPTNGGTIRLNVAELLPPANDAFAAATQITQLSYSDVVDRFPAATTEPGEPLCAFHFPTENVGSVWYAFTPQASGSLSARVVSNSAPTLAAYTGGSLTGLSRIGDCSLGKPVTFRATAGTTYYFQASIAFSSFNQLPIGFTLDITPPPTAGFVAFLRDPTVTDTYQFVDQSVDPGEAGYAPVQWDFGDGTVETLLPCCDAVIHRYAADGDYTVHLTVTTVDGRTASTSQVVQVRSPLPRECSSATQLIGQKSLARHAVDNDAAGKAEAFRAVAGPGGTASVLCLYLDATNAASTVVAGIYADNGSGHPGALLSQGSNTSPVNGAFNTIQIPPVALAAGTRYWITILSPLRSGTLRFQDHCCGLQSAGPASESGPSENSRELNLTTLPASWTTGAVWPRDGMLLGWGGGLTTP
jgi:PKD repeat protein